MNYLFIALIACAGGFLQAITGFGAGIVIMIVLPNILSMNLAPAVSGAICAPLTWVMSWRYHKEANLRKIIFPSICYIICSTIAIRISKVIDMNGLKPVFGVFLIVLAVYFMFFANKVKIKGTPIAAVVCGGISGFLGGFFGIGGPLMTLYFLAVTETKEEYLGSINATFAITSTYQLLLRIVSGVLTISAGPFVAAGIAGILIGRIFGTKVVDKLNGPQMKKAIYIFLAFAGIMTVINSL